MQDNQYTEARMCTSPILLPPSSFLLSSHKFTITISHHQCCPAKDLIIPKVRTVTIPQTLTPWTIYNFNPLNDVHPNLAKGWSTERASTLPPSSPRVDAAARTTTTRADATNLSHPDALPQVISSKTCHDCEDEEFRKGKKAQQGTPSWCRW